MKTTTKGFDLPADSTDFPSPGEILASTRTGTMWLIVEVREVDSRVWSNRWKLRVRRCSFAETEGRRIREFSSYRPGDTPAQYFGTPPGSSSRSPTSPFTAAAPPTGRPGTSFTAAGCSERGTRPDA